MVPAAASADASSETVPPLTTKVSARTGEQDDQKGKSKRHESDRVRTQGGENRPGDVAETPAEDVLDVRLQEQHDQEHAANRRHCQQQLERGFGNELDEDQRPVSGGDESAALECGFQRKRVCHRRASVSLPFAVFSCSGAFRRVFTLSSAPRELAAAPCVGPGARRNHGGSRVRTRVAAVRHQYGRGRCADGRGGSRAVRRDDRRPGPCRCARLLRIPMPPRRCRQDPMRRKRSSMSSTGTVGPWSTTSVSPSQSTNSPGARLSHGLAGRPTSLVNARAGSTRGSLCQRRLGLRLVHVLPIGTGDHPLGVVAVEYPLSPSPAGASIARAEYLFDTRVGPAALRMRYEGAGDQPRPGTIVLRAPGGEPLVEAAVAEEQIAHARAGWRRSVAAACARRCRDHPSTARRAIARHPRCSQGRQDVSDREPPGDPVAPLGGGGDLSCDASRAARSIRNARRVAAVWRDRRCVGRTSGIPDRQAPDRMAWPSASAAGLSAAVRARAAPRRNHRRGLDPALRPRPSRGSGRRVGGPSALFPAPMERREADAARRHSGVPPGGIVGGDARVRDRSRPLATEKGVACRAGDRASVLGRAGAGDRCRRRFTGVADSRLGRDRFHRCLRRGGSPCLPRRRVVPTCHRCRADPGTVHRVSTAVAALIPIREFLHGTQRPQRHRDALQRRGTEPLPDAAGAPCGGTCGDRSRFRLPNTSASAARSSPPSSASAFFVWKQTALARERLTSAVELYDATGTLVSRFALNFPEYTAVTQAGRAGASCQWEVFGEAAPFGSEERRMLHAERSICEGEGAHLRVLGAIVVHVIPDYRTLPFVTSQSPYLRTVSIRCGCAGRRNDGQRNRDCDLWMGLDPFICVRRRRVAGQRRTVRTNLSFTRGVLDRDWPRQFAMACLCVERPERHLCDRLSRAQSLRPSRPSCGVDDAGRHCLPAGAARDRRIHPRSRASGRASGAPCSGRSARVSIASCSLPSSSHRSFPS